MRDDNKDAYALAFLLLVIIAVIIILVVTNSKSNYTHMRLGSAKNVGMGDLPYERFSTIRNFTELDPRVTYHQGYRWYPTNANGGCFPEAKINYRVHGVPRRNGACAAVTKSQDECWACCDARTPKNSVAHGQCRIYCGGLPGGYRPSFDPQQFLYG